MKIIITEKQLIKLQENNHVLSSTKKHLFKYWDKYGFDTSRTVLNLFSLENLTPNEKLKLSIEWYGGYQKVNEILKQYENKIYVGEAGSYQFKFKVSNFRIDYDEGANIFFDAEVDGNGSVYIELDNGDVIDNVYDAYADEDIGFEVNYEIRETIEEKMFDKISEKLKIPIICDLMSVTERGQFKE